MEADYPEVPIQMTKLFHALDREFYITLVFRLQCDPWVSALTIAFWIWLEHITFENVVTKILSSSLEMINGLFEEAVVCLECIANTMPLFPHTSCELSLTQDLLGQHLCFVYLYENRAVAFDEINKVAGGVCMKALNDLMEMATNRNTQQHFVQMPTIKAPRERRTMFATFSKGHPVYEWEIREFFSKIFGDCIDSITMQPVRPHQQPLYALIVFTTPGILDFILNGTPKAKFSIHGRQVWMRKSVPKS